MSQAVDPPVRKETSYEKSIEKKKISSNYHKSKKRVFHLKKRGMGKKIKQWQKEYCR